MYSTELQHLTASHCIKYYNKKIAAAIATRVTEDMEEETGFTCYPAITRTLIPAKQLEIILKNPTKPSLARVIYSHMATLPTHSPSVIQEDYLYSPGVTMNYMYVTLVTCSLILYIHALVHTSYVHVRMCITLQDPGS